MNHILFEIYEGLIVVVITLSSVAVLIIIKGIKRVAEWFKEPWVVVSCIDNEDCYRHMLTQGLVGKIRDTDGFNNYKISLMLKALEEIVGIFNDG